MDLQLDIARRRLRSQYVSEATPGKPGDMVGWLGAVQAQDYAGAKWALGNALRYIVVLDGQVVGTWRRTINRDGVVVETDSFTRLTEAEERAVGAAAQRYGKFLGLPVALAIHAE